MAQPVKNPALSLQWIKSLKKKKKKRKERKGGRKEGRKEEGKDRYQCLTYVTDIRRTQNI